MSRLVRNSLFFVLGLMLGGLSVLVRAETIAATSATGWKTNFTGDTVFPDKASACSAFCAFYGAGTTVSACGTNEWQSNILCSPSGGNANGLFGVGTVYSCPTGQNWTLSGSTCTRPDCVAPEVRDPATGLCGAPTCQVSVNDQIAGTYSYPAGDTNGVQWCINNCSAWIVPTTRSKTTVWGSAFSYGTTCQGSGTNVPTPTVDPTQNPSSTNPPCAAGDGVVESAGVVKCVPAASNPQSDPPVVNKKSSTQTHPDGSQTITNTTTTCTGAGACSSVTNVTVTNASNGQPGIAGTPGTTTSTAEKPSEQQAEFCAKNPTLQICKGGMATEALQKETLDEVKKLTNPTATDDSAITGKTFEATSGRDALTEKDDELRNRVAGAVTPGEVMASKDAWEAAMSSGWLEPIERGGCAPYTATISGRTWVWDYCEKAGLISEIGAYCLWIMLAFGVFVMLTGGNRS